MVKFTIFTLLIIFTLQASLLSGQQLESIGGSNANASESGFVVQITSLTKGTICTGSIVAPDVILTAKHCVFSTRFQIIYGTIYLYRREDSDVFNKILVRSIHLHSKFDVALLILVGPIVSRGPFRKAWPIQLDSREVKCNTSVRLYGFGDIDDQRQRPTTLQSMVTRVKSGCRDFRDLFPYFLTTQAEGKSSCFGDSGGALVTSSKSGPKLVGVMHKSEIQNGRCFPGARNFYVRISSIVNFIQKFCAQCKFA